MYTVTIYPDSTLPHLTQIYAGLYDLEQSGLASIRFTTTLPDARWATGNDSLLVRVEQAETGVVKHIVFDLSDARQMASIPRLDLCDVYYKRSFSRDYLERIAQENRQKVRPYGLNYPCKSGNARHGLRQVLAAGKIAGPKRENLPSFFRKIGKAAADTVLSTLAGLYSFRRSYATSFYAAPTSAASETVLFQTRIWDAHEASTLNEREPQALSHLNEQRIELVIALRKAFGDRFTGGLEPTEYARRNYPELVTRNPTVRMSYVELLKKCLVCVSTNGLFDSIPWKIGEYLAASRCVVSENLRYELPNPLRARVHMLPFASPDECIKACEDLLNNPAEAARMRIENNRYYLDHVRPAALVGRCLDQAFL